jgi:hypothetical protein
LPTVSLVVESDCLNLINELHSPNKSRSRIVFVVQEIKSAIQDTDGIEFRIVPGTCNGVARDLASFPRIWDELGVLHGTVPSCASE